MMAMTSRYFDDMHIGDSFETALSAPITHDKIEMYFLLTDDRFDIHSDKTFAAACGLRSVMVPGNLVVAISTGLVYRAGYVAESLFVQAKKTVRFATPLYIGERIWVTDTVEEKNDRPEKPYGQVILRRRVFSGTGTLIQEIVQDYRILKTTLPRSNGVVLDAGAISEGVVR
jgi:acyl dehydratase